MQPVADLQGHTRFLRRIDHLGAILHRRRHRLLADHMLTRLRGAD